MLKAEEEHTPSAPRFDFDEPLSYICSCFVPLSKGFIPRQGWPCLAQYFLTGEHHSRVWYVVTAVEHLLCVVGLLQLVDLLVGLREQTFFEVSFG